MKGIKFKWNDSIGKKIDEAGVKGLIDALEYLGDQSDQTTPFRDGGLVQSRTVSVDEKKKIGAVSYDTPYAVRLHEHPEYHFHGNGRGKWLERTIQEEKKSLEKLAGGRLKIAIGAGGAKSGL